MLQSLKAKLNEKGVIIFKVKIIPKSKRNEVVGQLGDGLKVKIAALPEQGKANQELVNFLSDLFKIQKASIRILSGKTHSIKTIQIKK